MERRFRIDDKEYNEKLSFTFELLTEAATEMYQETLLLDDDTQCLYGLYAKELIELYIFAKYFTDFDVSEVVTMEDKVVLFNYLYPHLGPACYISEGMELVRRMADRMSEAAKVLYTGKTSIVNKLSVLMKDVKFEGDWLEEMAKNQAVNQDMIDIIGGYMKNKEKEDQMKPTIGGNVVSLNSFGKKE